MKGSSKSRISWWPRLQCLNGYSRLSMGMWTSPSFAAEFLISLSVMPFCAWNIWGFTNTRSYYYFCYYSFHIIIFLCLMYFLSFMCVCFICFYICIYLLLLILFYDYYFLFLMYFVSFMFVLFVSFYVFIYLLLFIFYIFD